MPPATITIPRVSPLRGSQPEGTLVITIGASPPGRPAVASRTAAGPAFAASARWDLPAANGLDVGLPGPPEPLSGPLEPSAFRGLAVDRDEEPPLPDEVGSVIAAEATAASVATEAGPGQVLHVHFGSAPNERIVAAFAELRTLIKSRPGQTPVVLHIPAGTGRTQEMRLGVGIAYDAELQADVRRRFGDLLQLRLA